VQHGAGRRAGMAWASKSGAWAQQVDEAEEGGDAALGPAPAEPKPAPAVPASLGGEEAFPSLGEAVTKKISKRDRKAKQTVSLKDFQSGAYKVRRLRLPPPGERIDARPDVLMGRDVCRSALCHRVCASLRPALHSPA